MLRPRKAKEGYSVDKACVHNMRTAIYRTLTMNICLRIDLYCQVYVKQSSRWETLGSVFFLVLLSLFCFSLSTAQLRVNARANQDKGR